ncbi:hypothetical protein [Polaromonas glacialis]|uniref:hypothetical protein n=1 Tax=Polaromonas glacialis TaxID=866564 RepID=UPI0012EC1A3E|nr:hypothetical protein [Polaromonas glacialis]
MKSLFMLLTVTALAGCGGSLKLLEEGKVHQGTYDAIAKSMTVSIDGIKYNGTYLLNNGSTFSSGFAGRRFVTMQGTSSATMGRGLLNSETGKVLRCEFAVQGMSAQGACQDNAGRYYDLIAGQ